MTTLHAKPGSAQHIAASKRSRAKTFLMAAITILATTGAVIAGNILAAQHSYRPDVTGSHEQTLSEQTQRVLARLEKPFRVVIATDLRTVDVRVKRQLQDVLEEMSRSTDNFKFTMLDTGATSGLVGYRELVGDLIGRERDLIREQSSVLELHNASAISLASYLQDTLSPALIGLRDSIGGSTGDAQTLRTYMDQAAAAARISASDLHGAASKSADALRWKLGEMPLPATDRAAAALVDALAPTVDRLGAISRDLERIAASNTAVGPTADQARRIAPEIKQRRDQGAVVLDVLRRLKRPDLLRITDVLQRGSAALVIGPEGSGLTAIDMDLLFPPGTLLDATKATRSDLRRRGEELVVTAISSILTPYKPVVILMHGETGELLTQPQLFARLIERMRLKGIDILEWQVAVSEEPPRVSSVDPEGKRPVVYVSLCPDSGAAPARAGGLSGSQRTTRLAEAVAGVAEKGGNILLNLNPSAMPGRGEADPIANLLTRFGLSADTGRPLVREQISPRGRSIDVVQLLQTIEVAGPINGAVRGLPTMLSWPITLRERGTTDKVRFTITPLFSIAAGEHTWLESEWSRIWQVPAEQRGMIPQADLPGFDEGRDGRWPEGRPTDANQKWLVAAAVERSELNQKPQRMVAMGSNNWFIDGMTHAVTNVDNRPALRNPGNMELFEASVYWLSHQDTLIAKSPTAQSVAMIGPMEESPLGRLRLAVILGMPLLVLVLGSLYRLVRG